MAAVGIAPPPEGLDAYWAEDADTLQRRLRSGPNGLTQADAAARLRDVGLNQLRPRRGYSRATLIGAQLKSPLLLILVFAAVVSAMSGAWIPQSARSDGSRTEPQCNASGSFSCALKAGAVPI